MVSLARGMNLFQSSPRDATEEPPMELHLGDSNHPQNPIIHTDILYPEADLLLYVRVALGLAKTRDEGMLAALRL